MIGLTSLFGTFETCRPSLERPVTGVDGKWLAHGQDDAIDPELNSRPARLFFGQLTGATSRCSVWVHRQGELKRGAVGYVFRGP
jgi:hypothetical protein